MKTLLLLLSTFSLLYADTIQLYNCYGNHEKLFVEGRILETKIFKETKPNDSAWINLQRKLKYLISDERKHAPITLTLDNQSFHTKTDYEGYFSFSLQNLRLSPSTRLIFALGTNQNVNAACTPFIPSQTLQVGIISDFDDTLIVSHVPHKLKLLRELLLKNYKQRQAVEGIAERFKKILQKSPDKPLFILTGSPTQLHEVIEKFLNYHHFPRHTLITKKIHGLNAYNPFRQSDYKSKQIRRLIALYPNIRWVLFGDNGEQDPTIYMNLAQAFPKQIAEIYIREVKSGKIEKIYPPSIQKPKKP